MEAVINERLEVPEYDEKALEKGARLADWLFRISEVPVGVEILNHNDVGFTFVQHFEGDVPRAQQCAVIIPSFPIPVSRVIYDFSNTKNRNSLTGVRLQPIREPFVVTDFEFEDFSDSTTARNTIRHVGVIANSPMWLPQLDNWYLRYRE